MKITELLKQDAINKATGAEIDTGTDDVKYLTPKSMEDQTTFAKLISPSFTTPALGTPSAGTLTNCTFPTLNQDTSGSAASLSATLAIASGGTGATTLAGASIPTYTSTNTFTNKRITKRVVTATDDATAEIDTDDTDQYQLTAIANATTFTVTGTPANGDKLIIRLKDAGTTKGLTWNAVFNVVGVTLPTDTTAGKTHYIGCVYNSANSKWDVLAVGEEA